MSPTICSSGAEAEAGAPAVSTGIVVAVVADVVAVVADVVAIVVVVVSFVADVVADVVAVVSNTCAGAPAICASPRKIARIACMFSPLSLGSNTSAPGSSRRATSIWYVVTAVGSMRTRTPMNRSASSVENPWSNTT